MQIEIRFTYPTRVAGREYALGEPATFPQDLALDLVAGGYAAPVVPGQPAPKPTSERPEPNAATLEQGWQDIPEQPHEAHEPAPKRGRRK